MQKQSRWNQFKRGKVAILWWGGGFLILFLCYWWVMTSFVIPDFWDTQYSLKPELLEKRISENPGHPLWLILGSSRVEDGLRPALLEPYMKKENGPLIFNFGLSGSDLFREYICLRRILEDGVKPQRVGIEILDTLLHHGSALVLNDPRGFVRARKDELTLFASFSTDPKHMTKCWWQSRLDPTYEYGMAVPGATRTVRLLPVPAVWPLFEPHPYDAWGWYPGVSRSHDEEGYRRALEATKKQFNSWFETYDVAPSSDLVLRMILDLCKKSGIDVFLLRMPESVDYQAFYPHEADVLADAYLHRIEKEYNARFINARSWVDPEGFSDGQHLDHEGAVKFTLRLGEELFGKPQENR